MSEVEVRHHRDENGRRITRYDVCRLFSLDCTAMEFIGHLCSMVDRYADKHLKIELDGGSCYEDESFPGFICVYYEE